MESIQNELEENKILNIEIHSKFNVIQQQVNIKNKENSELLYKNSLLNDVISQQNQVIHDLKAYLTRKYIENLHIINNISLEIVVNKGENIESNKSNNENGENHDFLIKNDNFNASYMSFDRNKALNDLQIDFISYSKDSSLLKKKIFQQEEKLNKIEKVIKLWNDSIEQVKKANDVLIEKILVFSDMLLYDIQSFDDCLELLQLLYILNNIMIEVSNEKKLLSLTIENTFIFPLKSLFNANFRVLTEYKSIYKKNHDDFFLISNKFLSTKRTQIKDSIRDSYFQLKKNYEISKFDYISKLNEISIITKVDVPEKICLFIFSVSKSFEQVNVFINKLKPSFIYSLEKIYYKQSKISDIKDKFKANKQVIFQSSNLSESIGRLTIQNNDKLVKEGFLNVKSSSGEGFKRRYVRILNDSIVYFKIKNDNIDEKEHLLCKLLLSTVKYNEKEYEFYFCFEIKSSDKKVFLLQSDSDVDAEDWYLTIRNAISNCICNYNKPSSSKSISNLKENYENSKENSKKNSLNKSSRIEKLISYSKCSDCNEDQPTWISQNWLVLICIDCSGIHRGLGSGVSKIKSLRLDNIDLEIVEILENLNGHDCINSIIELKIGNNSKIKPKKSSTIKEKESFIYDKYVKRLYIKTVDIYSIGESNLKEKVNNEDYLFIYQIVKNDIKEEYFSKQRLIESLPLVHYCAKLGIVKLIKLLLILGFDLFQSDEKNLKPLDYATIANKQELVEYILSKIEE